jgi:ATP-dependent Clp protease ATP-binding subunit ClpC
MKSSIKSILLIENIINRRARRITRKVLSITLLLLIIPAFLTGNYYLYGGIFLILFSIFLKMVLFEAFFHSIYRYSKIKDQNKSFFLESILYSTKGDVVIDFAYSKYGAYFLNRLGLSSNNLKEELEEDPTYQSVLFRNIQTEIENVNSISEYVQLLVRLSPHFNQFLKEQGVTEKNIEITGEWTEKIFASNIESEKWWTRKNLGRIPGIGKDWAYGQTDVLERFGRFVGGTSILNVNLYKNEVEELENILIKNKSSNAIVLGESDASRLTIIESLSSMIESGLAYPSLEEKKVFLVNSLTISQNSKSATDFENRLSLLLGEAYRIGNIILVIDNLPIFLESAETFGSDAMAVMVPYFRSASIQFIGLSDTDEYFQKLQIHKEIGEHFEVVRTEIKNDDSLLRIIQDEALFMEYKYGVFFTTQAVMSINEAAAQYFSDDVLMNKAVDLTMEIASHHKNNKKYLITKDDVLRLVESKTGIPVGEVTEDEKEKLLNLETELKKYVVGQDEALVSISQALRKSRSGVGKSNKPIGSFLFLGPTGVGKTETAKALAEIYFKEKAPMIRFDMSEFSLSSSLSRLIGDTATRMPGLLATSIREHPYGVLLLDEFEKGGEEVHNLFLQILDEGYFTDVLGKKVNVRNMLIIATSNAASDLIIKFGVKELQTKKTEIIDEIIGRNIFRPELLNRFDDLIFFRSLDENILHGVAIIQLEEFAKRLRDKGIELEINEDIISVVIEKGSDEKFGARAMNRAISDLIEEKISRGIIEGTIKPGSKICFEKTPEGGLEII